MRGTKASKAEAEPSARDVQPEEHRVDVSEDPQNHPREKVRIKHLPSSQSEPGTNFPSPLLLFLYSLSHPEESETTVSRWRRSE